MVLMNAICALLDASFSSAYNLCIQKEYAWRVLIEKETGRRDRGGSLHRKTTPKSSEFDDEESHR